MNTKRQKVRKAMIIISFLFFPVTIFYFSPVLIMAGAAKGILVMSAITFILLFMFSLFLGRAFCGWLCPAGGVQEICMVVKDTPIKRGSWIKYLIWVPWILTILFFFIKAGGIKKVEPLYNMNTFISVDNPYAYIIYYSFLGLIAGLALIVGRRSFCHHVCWIAPFMVAGRFLRNRFKWPSLRLQIQDEKCNSCHLCTKNCPMSLNVEEMVQQDKMENSECILCGMCVDTCRKDAIHYTFSGK